MREFIVAFLIVSSVFVGIVFGLGPFINDWLSGPRRRR